MFQVGLLCCLRPNSGQSVSINEEAFFQKHSRRAHVSPIFPSFPYREHCFQCHFFLSRCKSCLRYTEGNFNENPSVRKLAKILRAQASEHLSNFCEQFEQRPNFASTFKLNGIIRYPLPSQPKRIRRNNSLPSCECSCGSADYSCTGANHWQ